MQLFGREFPVGTVLEVAIDDRVVEKVTVGEDRAFKIAIAAPEQFGLHRLVVRDASGKPIDGFMFLVSHEDKPTNPPPKKRPVKQTTEKILPNPGGSR